MSVGGKACCKACLWCFPQLLPTRHGADGSSRTYLNPAVTESCQEMERPARHQPGQSEVKAARDCGFRDVASRTDSVTVPVGTHDMAIPEKLWLRGARNRTVRTRGQLGNNTATTGIRSVWLHQQREQACLRQRIRPPALHP